MTNWDKLTERQILKAQAEGKLTGLTGEGKPLPNRPGDALIDTADAVGHRIMAEAGALPAEIQLKAALDAALSDLKRATGAARKPAMARVADLQMRYEIARDARANS